MVNLALQQGVCVMNTYEYKTLLNQMLMSKVVISNQSKSYVWDNIVNSSNAMVEKYTDGQKTKRNDSLYLR